MAKTSEDDGETSRIVQEYASRIDTNVDYELKDFKKIMTTVYKEITTHKNPVKTAKAAKPVIEINPEPIPDVISKPVLAVSEPVLAMSKPAPGPAPEEESSEDEDAPKKRGRPKKPVKLDKDGNEKAKRKPSSYNNFVKERIEALKKEQTGTVIARVLMVIAASEWKNMTQDEKDAYKR